MKTEIYPSITTTANSWRDKIKEVDNFKLEKVCFFPTCLTIDERKEAYKLLEKSSVKAIPLVHVRHDFIKDELYYLKKTFKTNVFNIHSQKNSPFKLKNNLDEFNKKIFVELTNTPVPEEEFIKYAGICLDLTHVEGARLDNNNLYKTFIRYMDKYPIGVAHASAILNHTKKDDFTRKKLHQSHEFEKLTNFDYVKSYKDYLPEIIAIEVENSIEEQLKAKEYIEKILKD
ncbi:hypothetical protein ACFL0F_00685 [Patescibacteria group bacterium]